MKTFFDSAAFAKRYVEEPGSDVVDALCATAAELALSVVCIPEIVSALNRRLRERSLSARQYRTAKDSLFEDIHDAAIVNLTADVISSCTTILEENPVRAMEALHIACALRWGAELFVSADQREVSAARKAGLRTRLI
ncbi:type II toxin-antitoxin system VapC family toxin [Anaerobaca lacustris]|uniref:Type II toxin-antitoxin system VapC family toxin n=1 Tax=Anaerobaca lacustris TaxID=3044600 RepID=A0AAW6TPV4_9BACT|nr:type II toxin-antitoxin system VapC family toxin [Sedimentisphaerales bacterium M17dextr]